MREKTMSGHLSVLAICRPQGGRAGHAAVQKEPPGLLNRQDQGGRRAWLLNS